MNKKNSQSTSVALDLLFAIGDPTVFEPSVVYPAILSLATIRMNRILGDRRYNQNSSPHFHHIPENMHMSRRQLLCLQVGEAFRGD